MSLENLFETCRKHIFQNLCETQENAGWETGRGWNEKGARRKKTAKEALKKRGRGKSC